MRVAIAGAHGKIARLLTQRLAARGDTVIGLVRNPDHVQELRAGGVDPRVCDLEKAGVEDVAAAIRGADAAVFAAGAGPGSGAARKLTMDRDGAIKLLEAATAAETRRFIIVSSVGAENPPDGDDVFSVYVRAKAQADAAVQASDRDWTIIRPGRLTDDPATHQVRIQAAPFRGQIPREDVAVVLAELLPDLRAARRTLYVNSGQDSVDDALRNALATGRD